MAANSLETQNVDEIVPGPEALLQAARFLGRVEQMNGIDADSLASDEKTAKENGYKLVFGNLTGVEIPEFEFTISNLD